jgi:hypothetical protein
MSQTPVNQTFKQQQKRLVKSTFKKGFVNAIHSGSNTVDVSFAENPQTIIKNIPIAKSVSIASVIVGQRCRIDMFDETNPNDCVLAYVY